ncbi:MAG: phage holin family protein [Luteimonas sp.]
MRRIGAAGKATFGSALDTGRALRKLISADLALARSALGRALAWFAVAIVFGVSSALLLMAAAIALLQTLLGLSWLVAISAVALLMLIVTGVAVWRVSVFFDYAGMHATRRQLARIGIGDESDDDPSDGDAAADRASAAAGQQAAA